MINIDIAEIFHSGIYAITTIRYDTVAISSHSYLATSKAEAREYVENHKRFFEKIGRKVNVKWAH